MLIARICSKCQKCKPLEHFYRSKRGKYGRRADCDSCSRGYQAKYRDVSKERKSEYDRLRWIRTREQWSEQNKKWSKENPSRRYLINKRWRTRRSGQLGFVPDNIREILYASQDAKRYYCGEILTTPHLEHKTPLSRGGLHDLHNICLSCPQCNLRKGTKTEEEFFQREG